jgi:predicted TPR repeat methyltransferase
VISDEGAPFDLIGERYDESFVDRAAQLEAGEWLIEQLPAGARVLDHGCGSGVPTAVQLAKAGLTVTGVDESSRMLDLAHQRVPSGEFLLRDLRDLGPDLGEFDAVASFFALLMLPRQDVESVLRGLRERLRGPGLLALAMVEGDFDGFPLSFLGVPIKVTAFPSEQLRQLVVQAGFEVVDLREVDVEAEQGRIERQQYLRARAV